LLRRTKGPLLSSNLLTEKPPNALGAGLYSIGIPKDSIVKYEAAIETDQFLLIAQGTAAEVAKVKDIIKSTHPLYCELHTAELVAA